jgi:hypothetical protein
MSQLWQIRCSISCFVVDGMALVAWPNLMGQTGVHAYVICLISFSIMRGQVPDEEPSDVADVSASVAHMELEERLRQEERDREMAASLDPLEERRRPEEEDARLAAELFEADKAGADAELRVLEADANHRDDAEFFFPPESGKKVPTSGYSTPVRDDSSAAADRDLALAVQMHDEEHRRVFGTRAKVPASAAAISSQATGLDMLSLEESQVELAKMLSITRVRNMMGGLD